MRLSYVSMATTPGNPGTVARATRGSCMQPDGDVGGGDEVMATIFIADGLEIMLFILFGLFIISFFMI